MKHNDPMADIALVGPGGRDQLKRLIKSLQDTAKEGEDVEYVIAQALNELNDRINALDAQVAQQDYLVVDIAQYGLADYALDEFEMNTQLWGRLDDLYQQGVIYDIILKNDSPSGGWESKVISINTDPGDDEKLHLTELIIYADALRRLVPPIE